MQCFSIFIAIISCKEPNRIADLIGYPNLIIHSSIHCQVHIYDRRFCLKASTTVVPGWLTIDIIIWKLAFSDHLPVTKLHRADGKQNFNSTYKGFKCSQYALNRMKPSVQSVLAHLVAMIIAATDVYVHTSTSDKNYKAIFCPYKDKKLSRNSVSK